MLLVFCVLLIIILIITLRFEIEVENFECSNNKKQILNNFRLKIRVYLIDKLKIIELKTNKEKLKKIYNKQKNRKVNTKKIANKVLKNNREKIKMLEIIELKKSRIYIEIGTEEIFITTFLIPILASIFSIIFMKKCNEKKCYYKIIPIYEDKNIYKIKIDCIISIKMIHIIGIMWKILRKRDDKNGRTSNRRAYDYSYE